MLIDNATAAAFTEGFAVAARLRELLDEGDASDPAVAAEITRLSELMRPITAMALESAHEALARMGSAPRKTLEAMGLTREKVKCFADAFLAVYEDKPEAQA